MANLIGKVLQCVAKILLIVPIFISAIIAYPFFINEAVVIGIVIVTCGAILGVIVFLFVYGYGELINRVISIERILSKNQTTTHSTANNNLVTTTHKQ